MPHAFDPVLFLNLACDVQQLLVHEFIQNYLMVFYNQCLFVCSCLVENVIDFKASCFRFHSVYVVINNLAFAKYNLGSGVNVSCCL